MKVAMIAPFSIYPKGTVKVRMVPIAKALARHGHEVSIIIPPYDNPSYSGLEYEVSGVRIINVVFKDYRLIKYLLTTFMIIWKIIRLNPDVIYVFKPKGYSGLTAMFLAVKRKLRFFKHPRLVLDMDDWEGYGGFNDYFLAHSLYPRIMLDFFDFQERWIPRHVDAITVASKVLEERVRKWRVPSTQIFYIPNGTDSQGFEVKSQDVRVLKQKLGLDDVKVILLYTRFFEYKVSKVVEVLKRVRNELGAVKLLVLGRGDFGEEKELEAHAEREGLRDSIVFAGWIKPKDLPTYFSVGAVAIYPFEDTNLNRAKCPGKLVELMVAGKAIVADKVGQITEYIEDGKSGILIDPGNVKMFTSSVMKVLSNNILRETLGENAQKRISSAFTWKTLIIGVEQALFKALG